ncbi:MAG: transketolase [bacterium]|nr:transketolase [bacterium]
MQFDNKDTLAINTIKMLSVDAVQKANSGHPGLPMGVADYAYVVWTRFLRYNPKDITWINRDRFVLSGGHGSMLLYSLLHLGGFNLSLEELKNFRQWDSKTPGHPEYGMTPGVETTTGPLGQGFANGVGMAISAKIFENRFNTDHIKLFDSYVYGIVTDGDLMEGISAEAASFAGHLGLGNIIYFYDDNHITIEGDTSLTFSEDVGKRFEAYEWQVIKINPYNLREIVKAIESGQKEKNKPTLIIGRTNIAKGSPNKQDSASAHGEPLGEEEVKLTKQNIGWPLEPAFYIPEETKEVFEKCNKKNLLIHKDWKNKLEEYKTKCPQKAEALNNWLNKEIPENIADTLPSFGNEPVATRNAAGEVMQAVAEKVPFLIGGSADLSPSTKTILKKYESINRGKFSGRNMHFGIREHCMGGVLNGMALFGGIIPYGSTFFVFSDYMRPSIRLAAIMKQQVIYVFTHDSIFVGEDGPTHEPVEQAASLRLIPNLTVIRPSDASETPAAWIEALKNKTGPTAILLTRQKVPVIDRNKYPSAKNLSKGAYVLIDSKSRVPELVIIASGSEVSICMEATERLNKEGRNVRLVNIPSVEIFEAQSGSYIEKVIPSLCRKRLVVEAGSTAGWYKYAGLDGKVLGIDEFGASAPYEILAEKFGFTADNVYKKALEIIER